MLHRGTDLEFYCPIIHLTGRWEASCSFLHIPQFRVILLKAVSSNILEEAYPSFPANNSPLPLQSSASCMWPEKE